MKNTIINKLKNLDKEVKNIMKKGFNFSFLICILSILILITYKIYTIPIFYYSGTLLFKSSLMFFADFIIMGIGFDTIKKQMA